MGNIPHADSDVCMVFDFSWFVVWRHSVLGIVNFGIC